MQLTLNQVAELKSYRPLERVAILNLALKKLTPIQKVTLNLIKLVIFVPPFFLLAQFPPIAALAGVLVVLLAFSLLTKPIHIAFAKSHWDAAIHEFDKTRASSNN
ncbi:hypothetical protein K0504_06950 [Neiella marina]|uniref:Uncharacterized protein n=1 Tax=Neiella holothuriorum TaxID=2870530 RepID=A0ABS7EEK1_9GAMM|nr:DUF6170 family protein [Neiella holothuriorum]MBW8190767.1 hypothetical protein [Neiella holothuriorum]